MAIKDFIHKLTAPKMSHNFVGAPSFRHRNPGYDFLKCYDSDEYASIYPSIKALSNEFMKIRPYSIDANGKPVQSSAVNALYHPNQLDSSVSFFEKLAVMNLTHRHTYVLVWRREGNKTEPGGTLTQRNIGGYTFLENPAISRRNGRTYYNMGAQEFNDLEVMVIPGGVNPNDLYGGYAPGIASCQWAKLDDYIADYQQGFFENGAVPSGQFVVTASTPQEFNDIVDTMQARHKGAGQNNNVTYTHRPTDQSGKPTDAQIVWIPFASSNKDIDFRNLFDQANKRIDSAFGVPSSVRGVGENNNYATAKTDQQNFIRFAVEPLALRIYTQITHELNRITGGLGVAVTFDLELPAIADEEKVQAETKNVEVAALLQLLGKGFTLESAINALQLSNSYKQLAMGATTDTTIDNDKPDVDEGDEVNDSPDPEKIDGVTPLNKKKDSFKLETNEEYQERLEKVARKLLNQQINNAIEEVEGQPSNAVGDPTPDEVEEFIRAALAIISLIVIERGQEQHAIGIDILAAAGISTEAITDFQFTDDKVNAYQTYLSNVATTYSQETAEVIRSTLNRAESEGLPAEQIKRELRQLTDLEEYRVTRLARTETVRANGNGSLLSMEQIQDDTGVTIEKVWHTSSTDPCEFCRALDGTKTTVSSSFVPEGDVIVGVDGGVRVNEFVDMDIAQAHPNCRCFLTYEVVR